jgi:hypothetical protein
VATIVCVSSALYSTRRSIANALEPADLRRGRIQAKQEIVEAVVQ